MLIYIYIYILIFFGRGVIPNIEYSDETTSTVRQKSVIISHTQLCDQ